MVKYPHIQSFYHVVRYVRDRNNNPDIPEDRKYTFPITFIGTVKLHGTNAGVRVTPGSVVPQNRNRVLTLEDDNLGWARFVAQDGIADVFQEIGARVRGVERLPTDAPVTLFGEYCGPGIQKKCAIHQLPQRQFVIFAAATEDEQGERVLLREPVLTKDKYEEQNIFAIREGLTRGITFRFTDEEDIKRRAELLAELTEETENQCPWGALFGIRGLGEGIVWTPTGSAWHDTNLYFKTKGEKHKHHKTQDRLPVDPEKVASIEEFVERFVTDVRLEQGLAHLEEQGLEVQGKNTGPYLQWIAGDIQREGLLDMEENGLTWQDIKKQVTSTARTWFLKKCDDVLMS